MNGLALGIFMYLVTGTVVVAPPQLPPAESIDHLVMRVAGEGSDVQKTTRLVKWINTEFQWTATDYERRTPEQIITRRGGNCAELARVLARLLDAGGVKYRTVREINIQPANESRQSRAARLIAAQGNQLSVFGLRHNDHTWLEVYDGASNSWVPADPAIGIVGIVEWEAARLGLGARPKPAVAAVEPIAHDMIVPFVVAVAGKNGEDRSSYYLIDQFNQANNGRLDKLPAWREWTELVRELSSLARQAFNGEINLHEHAAEIERLAIVYDQLRGQAAVR